MFEDLVADRRAAVSNADICRRLDKELAVEMVNLLAKKLEPIKVLSNFAIKPSIGAIKVEFDQATVRGDKAYVTIDFSHRSPEQVSIKVGLNHGQPYSGYPPAAMAFNTAEKTPEEMLDSALNHRRADFAALLRNWG